jgi:hypothetical protein
MVGKPAAAAVTPSVVAALVINSRLVRDGEVSGLLMRSPPAKTGRQIALYWATGCHTQFRHRNELCLHRNKKIELVAAICDAIIKFDLKTRYSGLCGASENNGKLCAAG